MLCFRLLSVLFLHFVTSTLLVMQVFSNVFTTGNSIRHHVMGGMDLGLYFILREGEQQQCVFAAGCEWW